MHCYSIVYKTFTFVNKVKAFMNKNVKFCVFPFIQFGVAESLFSREALGMQNCTG